MDLLQTLHRFTPQMGKAFAFARRAVSEHGGPSVDAEHVLLGIMTADAPTLTRYMSGEWTLEAVQERVIALATSAPKATDHDSIPIGATTLFIVANAAQEADALGSSAIRPEHVLLAIAKDKDSKLGGLLTQAGITAEKLVRTLKDTSDRV